MTAGLDDRHSVAVTLWKNAPNFPRENGFAAAPQKLLAVFAGNSSQLPDFCVLDQFIIDFRGGSQYRRDDRSVFVKNLADPVCFPETESALSRVIRRRSTRQS